jgi:hypothetical protein
MLLLALFGARFVDLKSVCLTRKTKEKMESIFHPQCCKVLKRKKRKEIDTTHVLMCCYSCFTSLLWRKASNNTRREYGSLRNVCVCVCAQVNKRRQVSKK